MVSDDSEKTEEPTEHKLQEARKKGQVLKSQDIVMWVTMFATFATLFASAGFMGRMVYRYGERVLSPDAIAYVATSGQFSTLVEFLIQWLLTFMIVLLPMLVVALIAGIIGNVAQIGLLFTFEPVSPKFNKINPVQGFKRIFSRRSVVELIKNVLKLGIIGDMCYYIIK